MSLSLSKKFFYCGEEITVKNGITTYIFSIPFNPEDGYIGINSANGDLKWFSEKNNNIYEYSDKVKILPNRTIYNWWEMFSNKFKISENGQDIIEIGEDNLNPDLEICEKSLEKYLRYIWMQKNNSNKKRIFIDLSSFLVFNVLCDINTVVFKTGVQRVTERITNHLVNSNYTDYEIIPVYSNKKWGYIRALKYESHLKGYDVPGDYLTPISYKKGDILFILNLEIYTVPEMEEELTEMNKNGVKVIFFLHDIFPITNKRWFKYEIYDFYKKWLNISIKYDGFICNSKKTLEDLKKWLKDNNHNKDLNLSYVHLGSDIYNPIIKRQIDNKKEDLIFLMLGTIEPRKGYLEVLNSFTEVCKSKKDIKLLIVGNYGWEMNDFKFSIYENEFYNKNIFWYENITDGDLFKILNETDCLISSSYDEGFGLPLVECANIDIPIIARDIQIYRELFKDDEVLFFKNFEGVIEKWIDLYRNNNHPVCKRKFSTWKDTSDKIFKIITNI